MNVILIPFFLAANVIFNNTSEWAFGPEYKYDLNMTYVMKMDPHEPSGTMQLISDVKCRPKFSDSLICHLYNFTIITFLKNHNSTREINAEQMFEIKFNERGVESLLIEPPSRLEVVNVIRKIANQFSTGADLKRKISMSQFMTRENTTMGNCATMFKITQEEPVTRLTDEDDADFRLVVLPMVDVKPGTTLLMEKSRMGCINPPRYVDFLSGILKMGRFFTELRINGTNGFESITEMDGKVRPPRESPSSRILTFKEIIQISLNSIKPAQDALPSISYGELIDLNINIDIPSNFIN